MRQTTKWYVKNFRFKEKSLPALTLGCPAGQTRTMSAHRSIDKADHYARDNVGIMKPPDVTWWPWLLLTGLLVGTIIIIWLKERGK